MALVVLVVVLLLASGTWCDADDPRTSVTTIPTVPGPTPLPSPAVGSYSVSSRVNSSICLLATMGLQIRYKAGAGLNVEPNRTEAAGSCGFDSSDSSLLLSFPTGSAAFAFKQDGGRFHLHAVNVTVALSTGKSFHATAENLSLWMAPVGASYMCRGDVTHNISDRFSLRTVTLRLQPFAVLDGHFAAAQECAADDESMLVPIGVSAALGGLIIIVLVAYLVSGKRKTYTGYQTL
ncbi:lysosome-associated membrane glycoprotein 2-like [Arapaima gigas]